MQIADHLETPSPKAAHSRLWQRLHRRYADVFQVLPQGTPELASMQQALNQLLSQGHNTSTALRVLRQLVIERLMVLDCEQAASLTLSLIHI